MTSVTRSEGRDPHQPQHVISSPHTRHFARKLTVQAKATDPVAMRAKFIAGVIIALKVFVVLASLALIAGGTVTFFVTFPISQALAITAIAVGAVALMLLGYMQVRKSALKQDPIRSVSAVVSPPKEQHPSPAPVRDTPSPPPSVEPTPAFLPAEQQSHDQQEAKEKLESAHSESPVILQPTPVIATPPIEDILRSLEEPEEQPPSEEQQQQAASEEHSQAEHDAKEESDHESQRSSPAMQQLAQASDSEPKKAISDSLSSEQVDVNFPIAEPSLLSSFPTVCVEWTAILKESLLKGTHDDILMKKEQLETMLDSFSSMQGNAENFEEYTALKEIFTQVSAYIEEYDRISNSNYTDEKKYDDKCADLERRLLRQHDPIKLSIVLRLSQRLLAKNVVSDKNDLLTSTMSLVKSRLEKPLEKKQRHSEQLKEKAATKQERTYKGHEHVDSIGRQVRLQLGNLVAHIKSDMISGGFEQIEEGINKCRTFLTSNKNVTDKAELEKTVLEAETLLKEIAASDAIAAQNEEALHEALANLKIKIDQNSAEQEVQQIVRDIDQLLTTYSAILSAFQEKYKASKGVSLEYKKRLQEFQPLQLNKEMASYAAVLSKMEGCESIDAFHEFYKEGHAIFTQIPEHDKQEEFGVYMKAKIEHTVNIAGGQLEHIYALIKALDANSSGEEIIKVLTDSKTFLNRPEAALIDTRPLQKLVNDTEFMLKQKSSNKEVFAQIQVEVAKLQSKNLEIKKEGLGKLFQLFQKQAEAAEEGLKHISWNIVKRPYQQQIDSLVKLAKAIDDIEKRVGDVEKYLNEFELIDSERSWADQKHKATEYVKALHEFIEVVAKEFSPEYSEYILTKYSIELDAYQEKLSKMHFGVGVEKDTIDRIRADVEGDSDEEDELNQEIEPTRVADPTYEKPTKKAPVANFNVKSKEAEKKAEEEKKESAESGENEGENLGIIQGITLPTYIKRQTDEKVSDDFDT